MLTQKETQCWSYVQGVTDTTPFRCCHGQLPIWPATGNIFVDKRSAKGYSCGLIKCYCLLRASWWLSCTVLSTKKWVSWVTLNVSDFWFLSHFPHLIYFVVFIGAIRDTEEVEALETREEHRGGISTHLQQFQQHKDGQPAEPHPSASPPSRHHQIFWPGLQSWRANMACGSLPQRDGPWQRGGKLQLPAERRDQQLHPCGGYQPVW